MTQTQINDKRQAAEEKAELTQVKKRERETEELSRRNLVGRALYRNFVCGKGRALYHPEDGSVPRLITYKEYNALNRPTLNPHAL